MAVISKLIIDGEDKTNHENLPISEIEITKEASELYNIPIGTYHFAENTEAIGTCENAVAEPIIDMKLSGNSVQQILPDEYQQLEYIESTGTQCIDTGVIGKSGVKMIANINVSVIPTIASPFCGCFGNNQRCYLFMVHPEEQIGMAYVETTYTEYTLNVDKKYKIETDFTLNQQCLKVDDETILSSNNSVQLNTGNNIFIFGYNHNALGGIDTRYPVSFKLYDFKLYDNETLIRDFIPCYRKSDNEIGLYDLVENMFYTNAGTGEFVKGNNAPTPEAPIEIESVGERTKNLFDGYDYINVNVGASINNNILLFYDDYRAVDCPIYINKNTSKISQITCSFRIRRTNKPVNIILNYTDDTKEYKSLPENDNFVEHIITSNANKTIKDIRVNYNYGLPLEMDLSTSQIEEGDTATDYEPYGYKVPVKVSGKNLFDLEGALNIWGASYTKNGEEFEITSIGKGYSEPIILFDQDTIVSFQGVINDVSSETGMIEILDSNGTRHALYEGRNQLENKLANRIRLNYSKNGTFKLKNFQVELGSTATKYEPYIEPITTNIYLKEPLRKMGDYADYIDYKNKKVVRNVEVLDDSGTQTIENSYQGLATPIEETIDIPQIETFKGTNIFSTETTIQPSEIKINYWKQIGGA